MTKKIIIGGCGFAGLWAAISAARAVSLTDDEENVDISIVSPTPHLTIRPRLYEAGTDDMNPAVGDLLEAVGVRHVGGVVETINAKKKTLIVARNDGSREALAYDRFVLATGSEVYKPAVPGLEEYAFDIDQLEAAESLDAHLKGLGRRPAGIARDTVVIAGGGLTGLETATEMPLRLRSALGENADFRIVLVDAADAVGLSMGEEALPFIQEALALGGIETRPGVHVTAIEANLVTLSSGECIDTNTVIWTAGMRASPIAAQIPGKHDRLGRVICDAFLRAPAGKGIFVTGDAAHAATDDRGNSSVMSCQHALSLGRVAGYNAAAELIGLNLHPYRQPRYVTCLDLGDWGALYTEGREREVQVTHQDAKKLKKYINKVWIYPPAADRDAAFAIANPDFVIVP